MTETVHITDSYNDIKPTISIHSTEHFIHEGRLAMLLVERWGMVQGKDGGEDSSGRARLDLMPIDEVVARACDTAALLLEEIRRRNWVVPVPQPEVIREHKTAKIVDRDKVLSFFREPWDEVEAEVKRREEERRASRR